MGAKCIRVALFAALLTLASGQVSEVSEVSEQLSPPNSASTLALEDQLHAAVEAVGQVEERLWGVLDGLMQRLFGGAQLAAEGDAAAPGAAATGRRLQAAAAAAAPPPATLDAISDKLKSLSKDLILMEVRAATQSVGNSVKAAFGLPTSSSADNATAIAAQATAEAAASLLLSSVQDSLSGGKAPAAPPAAASSFPLLSRVLGKPGSSPSPAASSLSRDLASGTQLFTGALNRLSGAGTSAGAGSASGPMPLLMGAVGQLNPSGVGQATGAAASAAGLLNVLASGGAPSMQSLLDPSALGAAVSSLLGAPSVQGPAAALDQQAQTVMSAIAQHSVDFASLFKDASASVTASLARDAAAGGGSGSSSTTTAAAAATAAATAPGRRLQQQVAVGTDAATRLQELLGSQELVGRYRALKAHWDRVMQPQLASTRRGLLSLSPEDRTRMGRALSQALAQEEPSHAQASAGSTDPASPLPPPVSSPAPQPAAAASSSSVPPAAGQVLPAAHPAFFSPYGMEVLVPVLAQPPPSVRPAVGSGPAPRGPAAGAAPQVDVVELVLVQSAGAVAAGQQLIDGLLGLLRDALHMTLSAALEEEALLLQPTPQAELPLVAFQERGGPMPVPVAAAYPPGEPLAAAATPAGTFWQQQQQDEAPVFVYSDEALLMQGYGRGEGEGLGLLVGRRLQGVDATGAAEATMPEGAWELQEALDDGYSEASYGDEYAEEEWLDEYGWLTQAGIAQPGTWPLRGEAATTVEEAVVAPLALGLVASSSSPSSPAPTTAAGMAADPAGLPDDLLEWVVHVASLLAEAGGDLAIAPGALLADQQLPADAAPGAPAEALPNFAVFGIKQARVAGNASGDAAAAGSGGGLSAVAAAVVVPLSGGAVRAPAPRQHPAGSLLEGFSPKYWGITVSLAFVGMLLGALAVAVVRRSSTRLGQDDSYTHIPGVPQRPPSYQQALEAYGSGGAKAGPADGSKAWQAALQSKVAQQQGPVAKKLSNLPA